MLNILKQYNILLFFTLNNSVVKLFYLSLTVLLVCNSNITLRISNLIGKGLPCHGSRCRFESDLIRGLGYIVYILYSFFYTYLSPPSGFITKERVTSCRL